MKEELQKWEGKERGNVTADKLITYKDHTPSFYQRN